MKASTKAEVTEVVISLTPDEACRLYDDIANTLDAAGITHCGGRGKQDLPRLYELYDALYAVGAPSGLLANGKWPLP